MTDFAAKTDVKITKDLFAQIFSIFTESVIEGDISEIFSWCKEANDEGVLDQSQVLAFFSDGIKSKQI